MADLSVFDDPSLSGGKRWSWETREKLIRDTFPSIDQLDWDKAFKNDIELLGWLVRDYLKYDQAEVGRPGPRPALDVKKSGDRFVQFMGEDYSLESFSQTLDVLKGKLSIRGLAAKTGLDYNQIYRLLNGRIDPDVYSMQKIAAAFGKHPSYFLEYRVLYAAQAVANQLFQWPEASVNVYRKIRESAEGSS